MAFFKISYKLARKQHVKIIEANNRQKALLEFNNHEYGIITNITEISEPISHRIKKHTGKLASPIKNKRVKQEEYITFLDQLSTMLDAGISVNLCLQQCIEDTKDKSIKAIFRNILSDIESGQSLTQSASRYKKQLTNLSISLFNLGEQTGTLSNSIKQLSRILAQIHENKQKFKQAIRYPIFIVIIMIIAFSVVITMVVPQFKQFFEESKMELPAPTKALLSLEHFLTTYGLYLAGSCIAFIFIVSIIYNKSYRWKHFIDKVLLKIYLIGRIIYYSMIGRFTYLFQILTDTGIPMLDAIDIAKSVVDNSYIKGRLDMINNSIEDGKTLTQGFRDSGQFENMVIQMVNAGETTGSLSLMLGKVSKVYNDKYNYIVNNISSILEPILITAIAIFVFILALGIFLPMWSLVNLAN